MRAKIPELTDALAGRFNEHHALLCSTMLARIDHADATIAELTERIVDLQGPHEAAVHLLVGIPGVSYRTAQVILAEIGTDMSRFPTAGHLASWAGMCPGNNESAGKHRSGRTRHGSKWLRTALDRSRQGRRPIEEHLPVRPLPPHPRPARPSQSRRRRRPLDPGDLLAPAVHRRDLHRPRCRLPRQATQLASPTNAASSPNSKPSATKSPSNPPRRNSTFGLRPNGGNAPAPPRAHTPAQLNDSHLRGPPGAAC